MRRVRSEAAASRAVFSVCLWGLSSFAVCACTEPSFLRGDASDNAKASDEDGGSDEADPVDNDDDASTKPAEPALDASGRCSTDSCAFDARAAAAAEAGASASDPGTPDAGSRPSIDAEAGSNGALDADRSQWVGRYATRSYVFAFDDSTQIRSYASYLTVAEVKPTAEGGLVLEEQLCRFKAMFNSAGVAIHEIKYPVGTRLSAALTYDGQGFSSRPGSAKVGYGAAPADCAGKSSSSSSVPVRPWLVGNTCDCPTDLSVLPPDAKDCRVFDQDQDGLPGATYQASWEVAPWPVQTTVFRVAQEVKLRLVNGSRMGDRLSAQREFADATKIFSCITDGQPKDPSWECPLGIIGPCSAELNPVELVPISAQLDCAAIIQQETTLFTMAEPQFPAACSTAH